MPDEDAFLAAIRAAPEGDAPRAVYADWLDERADPRAVYVRLAVAADRPHGPAPEVLRRLDTLDAAVERDAVLGPSG